MPIRQETEPKPYHPSRTVQSRLRAAFSSAVLCAGCTVAPIALGEFSEKRSVLCSDPGGRIRSARPRMLEVGLTPRRESAYFQAMIGSSKLICRGLRAVLAYLAILANVAAVGQPVAHAWAHETEHHDEVQAESVVDHPHDEIHPLALHDDYVPAQRSGPDASAALPIDAFELTVAPATSTAAIHSVLRAPSRAPPGQDRARSPPPA